jgi:hypothetical protein
MRKRFAGAARRGGAGLRACLRASLRAQPLCGFPRLA